MTCSSKALGLDGAGLDGHGQDRPVPVDARCDLQDHGPITWATFRRLACDAGVARIVTRGASQILDVGAEVDTIPRAVRRAVRIRDRGCVFPGCDRPPAWCHCHHIVWRTPHGGRSHPHNLALLCSRHHHLVHEGGYTMARGPDRALTFTRPDGTTLTAPYLSHPNIRTRAPTRGSPSHHPPVPPAVPIVPARAARAGQPDRPRARPARPPTHPPPRPPTRHGPRQRIAHQLPGNNGSEAGRRAAPVHQRRRSRRREVPAGQEFSAR